jgi:membrane protease subunit (stomatin/prohibitin family)
VYLLDFVQTSRQQFFWLQESKSDSDEENATKVNDYLTNGPPQTTLSQQQQGLMSMLQQAQQNTSGQRQQQQRQQVQMDQLQQIMQSIAPRGGQQTQQPSTQQQQQQQGGQGKYSMILTFFCLHWFITSLCVAFNCYCHTSPSI